MTTAQRQKLMADYIRSRNDDRQSLERMRKDKEKFIRLGLLRTDDGESGT